MYMNYLSKTIVFKTLLIVTLASCLSVLVSFFLPNEKFLAAKIENNTLQYSFNVAQSFNLASPKKVQTTSSTTKEKSGAYLLKDFVLNGIFLNGEESLVIIKDVKGGIFLYLNESHLNYTLIEVYNKKAKFKKGVHFYWCFLDPNDEKEFQESEALASPDAGPLTEMRKTIARPMFEEIKFKDGQYYIPKEMLSNPAEMRKHFTSAGSRIHFVNGSISFQITYVAASSVFQKLGIKKNDFIIEANGEKFKTINDPIKFFQNIKNVKNLSLTIRRGNQTQELQYEIY